MLLSPVVAAKAPEQRSLRKRQICLRDTPPLTNILKYLRELFILKLSDYRTAPRVHNAICSCLHLTHIHIRRLDPEPFMTGCYNYVQRRNARWFGSLVCNCTEYKKQISSPKTWTAGSYVKVKTRRNLLTLTSTGKSVKRKKMSTKKIGTCYLRRGALAIIKVLVE